MKKDISEHEKQGINKAVFVCLLPIRFYRYAISPLFPARCRYYPSCSAYAEEALKVHGVLNGSRLAALRLLRCHPWGKSGYDPVPEIKHNPTATCCEHRNT